MEDQSYTFAANMDERGFLQIRSLIAKYGLKEFLEAVSLEVHDIVDSGSVEDRPEDEELQEARRVEPKLNEIHSQGIRGFAC
jgi:hypothetical protein